MTWDVQSATASHGAVFRREENTPWRSVAVVQQNGAGDLVFDDATVQPGGRYAYLAAVPSEQGTDFGGEVWVDVPNTVGVEPGGGLAFALEPVVPNPVVNRFTVSFVLTSAAPARLDLYNIAGRRVVSREVGSLGPGAHFLELGPASDLSPGLYFLKLEQAGLSKVRRVVIEGS